MASQRYSLAFQQVRQPPDKHAAVQLIYSGGGLEGRLIRPWTCSLIAPHRKVSRVCGDTDIRTALSDGAKGKVRLTYHNVC